MRTIFFTYIFAALLSSCSSKIEKEEKETLPVYYSSDRFFLAPVTPEGDTLMFYTDTGGGANMIYKETVEKLNLDVVWLKRGEDSVKVVDMPSFSSGASIPSPPSLGPYKEKLRVVERQGHAGSGFLGRLWFATRSWEFNYPEGTLTMISKVDWANRPDDHTITLGFKSDSAGNPATYFPRVAIEVAGDSIDVLFDTGATADLSEKAASKLNMKGNTKIGTSFIIESIFKKWQEKHPDWQVITNADKRLQMPMIKVPTIKIAGHEVGPVWFTMRPDNNFTEYMSQWMDKTIEGAIGGSALQYFKITVDYPNQAAAFQKVE